MAKSHLDHFAPATLRGGPGRPFNGWVCLSFNQTAGQVIRIRLPMRDVVALGEGLDVTLGKKTLEIRLPACAGYGDECGVQSLSSSGMPSVVGSPKLGHIVKPLANSYAAVCGSSYPSSESPSKTMCQRMSCWMAIQKIPRRVGWLYATVFMVLCALVGWLWLS